MIDLEHSRGSAHRPGFGHRKHIAQIVPVIPVHNFVGFLQK